MTSILLFTSPTKKVSKVKETLVHLISDKYCVGDTQEGASLTVASNYSNIVEKLEHIIDCAQLKYRVRAYVHWYEKHGLEQVMCVT